MRINATDIASAAPARRRRSAYRTLLENSGEAFRATFLSWHASLPIPDQTHAVTTFNLIAEYLATRHISDLRDVADKQELFGEVAAYLDGLERFSTASKTRYKYRLRDFFRGNFKIALPDGIPVSAEAANKDTAGRKNPYLTLLANSGDEFRAAFLSRQKSLPGFKQRQEAIALNMVTAYLADRKIDDLRRVSDKAALLAAIIARIDATKTLSDTTKKGYRHHLRGLFRVFFGVKLPRARASFPAAAKAVSHRQKATPTARTQMVSHAPRPAAQITSRASFPRAGKPPDRPVSSGNPNLIINHTGRPAPADVRRFAYPIAMHGDKTRDFSAVELDAGAKAAIVIPSATQAFRLVVMLEWLARKKDRDISIKPYHSVGERTDFMRKFVAGSRIQTDLLEIGVFDNRSGGIRFSSSFVAAYNERNRREELIRWAADYRHYRRVAANWILANEAAAKAPVPSPS